MPRVRELLNQVWGLFRQVGIADDLTIIGHMDGTLLGVMLEAVESTTLTVVERFPATDKTPAFLLAEGRWSADAHHVCIEINLRFR